MFSILSSSIILSLALFLASRVTILLRSSPLDSCIGNTPSSTRKESNSKHWAPTYSITPKSSSLDWQGKFPWLKILFSIPFTKRIWFLNFASFFTSLHLFFFWDCFLLFFCIIPQYTLERSSSTERTFSNTNCWKSAHY